MHVCFYVQSKPCSSRQLSNKTDGLLPQLLAAGFWGCEDVRLWFQALKADPAV